MLEFYTLKGLSTQHFSSVALLWWHTLETSIEVINYMWDFFEVDLYSNMVLNATIYVLINELQNLKEKDMSTIEYVN